ncbi:hypothetical protein AX16_004079 [Volvariella volvacea WC 439]|nr:hypothetical protein AX16_004079 [Volvariella volvacea WC 439]
MTSYTGLHTQARLHTHPQYQSQCPPWPPLRANSPPTAHLFNGGNVFNESGSIMTCVGDGNMIYYTQAPQHYDQRARDSLRMMVVQSAMHTGDVRADPLGCHEETRQAILSDVITWIEDRYRERGVLWLCGPAGIGKSAIAKTTADRLDLESSKGQVAASFFFWRGDPHRNNLLRFVSTIAYQLAICFERVGKVIDKAIERDRLVLSADMAVQWKKLIVDPIKEAYTPDDPPAVIIIDGLDECGNESDQRAVLNLIASCGPDFPLAFILASRPEVHIVNSFEAEPLSSLCRPRIDLALCKDDNEMKAFVRSSFSAIYVKHKDILKSYASAGVWPSDDVVDGIVFNADGQYIYPTTLFRYIDEDGIDPEDRLRASLSRSPGSFSSLDSLYMQIMQGLPNFSNDTQDLLFLICCYQLYHLLQQDLFFTNADLTIILGLSEAKYRLALRKLHSVLHIPEDASGIPKVHHLSFSEFLDDPRRSHQYNIEPSCAIRIIERCLTMLESDITKNTNVLARCWWATTSLVPRRTISKELRLREENFDYEALGAALSWDEPDLLGAHSLLCYQCKHWGYNVVWAKIRQIIPGQVVIIGGKHRLFNQSLFFRDGGENDDVSEE